MKKNILFLLMSFICAVAPEVSAEDFYAKVFGGANFLQNTKITQNRAKYDTGYIVAGSLGYTWCYGLSLEGEYAFRRNGIRKIHLHGEGSSQNGHFQSSSYMANVLWDLPLSYFEFSCLDIRPFVGAGMGYDFQQMHATNSRVIFNQKWRHFSWQVMAGLAYPIFCNTELTLEYKFHQGGSHFNSNSIGLGLVYKFEL